MMKLTSWIMRFAPFGVFGLIAKTVSIHGLGVLGGLGKYMLCVVLGLLIHAGILLFFYLKVVGRMGVGTFLAGVREPLAIAFSTASSAVALPVTMESCHKNLKVPKSVTGFVLPLGATINMDGTALYEAAGAMFIAQAYGISLGPEQQFIIFLTAILASVGAAAIPHAGLITMAIVLASVGLPLAGIGLILAIDKPLDMCRTMVNVMGDSIGTVVVGRGVPQDG
jgi:proton glutamate symport protein